MGWSNPPVPWSELERRLSGRPRNADGGDSPAWSNHRGPYQPPPVAARPPVRRPPSTPYAELHCHSAFSFLDGASPPEELAEEAVRLGLEAVALTDHDGFYGVVRFAEAAGALGLPTVFGAELTLDLWAPSAFRRENDLGGRQPAGKPSPKPQPQAGLADPDGRHLVVLARDPGGYGRLARTISAAHMTARPGVGLG
ncbi:MAG: PHP domain-containing protein, partial [Acidimicrobiales bacterium]